MRFETPRLRVLSPVVAAIQASKEADESRRDCAVAAIRYGLLFIGVYYLLEFVLGVLGGILAAGPVGPLSICPESVLRVLGQWCVEYATACRKLRGHFFSRFCRAIVI